MTHDSPSAHVWLDVPETCRIEGELITDDELRVVFGDRRADGHTLVFERGSLERLRCLASELLAGEPDSREVSADRVSAGP